MYSEEAGTRMPAWPFPLLLLPLLVEAWVVANANCIEKENIIIYVYFGMFLPAAAGLHVAIFFLIFSHKRV